MGSGASKGRSPRIAPMAIRAEMPPPQPDPNKLLDVPVQTRPQEYEVFLSNYSKLSNLLKKSWMPQFVEAGIITPNDADSDDLKKMILDPVSRPLENGNTAPFYAMLRIMQNQEAAAKDLADEILAKLKSNTEKIPSAEPDILDEINFVEKFRSCEKIGEAFVFLTTKLRKIMTRSFLFDIKMSCISQINTPNGAQLSDELKDAIKGTETLEALFEVLCDCPYWNWLDLRLLKAMVIASDSVKAKNLVESYESVIFQRKLREVLPNIPIKRSLTPSKYYTTVISKVNLQLDDPIKKLLIHQSQLETVIMDIKKGMCAFNEIEIDCIKVHWYIPSELADHAYKSAVSKKEKFYSIGLQLLQIGGYPEIVIEDAAMSAFSSSVFEEYTLNSPTMPFTSEQQKWIENFVNGTVREFQVPNMSRLSSFADIDVKPTDIVINAAPEQAQLSKLLKDKLEAKNHTVYCNTELHKTYINLVAKAIVTCKVFVFIVGVTSAGNPLAANVLSMAYICSTPILIASIDEQEIVYANMDFGMKLVLPSLKWYKFSSLDDKVTLSSFIEDVGRKAKKRPESYTHRGRVYKHTFTRKAIKHEPLVEHRNFWDCHFGKKQQVTWDQFQNSFQREFKAEISEVYKSDKSSEWLFNVIKNEVFKATDMVTKDKYLGIIDETEHGRDIWKTVIEKATEKYCIKEVFNMDSTVRLTAVENLGIGKYQTPAVVDALIALLHDDDPNIRAVAAISLGQTGTKELHVVDRLLVLLDDKDRVCRQSACLALGRMKAEKAVNKISDIWRNDYISVVRDAAETALKQIGGPDADQIIKVTKILLKEITYLEKKQS